METKKQINELRFIGTALLIGGTIFAALFDLRVAIGFFIAICGNNALVRAARISVVGK